MNKLVGNSCVYKTFFARRNSLKKLLLFCGLVRLSRAACEIGFCVCSPTWPHAELAPSLQRSIFGGLPLSVGKKNNSLGSGPPFYNFPCHTVAFAAMERDGEVCGSSTEPGTTPSPPMLPGRLRLDAASPAVGRQRLHGPPRPGAQPGLRSIGPHPEIILIFCDPGGRGGGPGRGPPPRGWGWGQAEYSFSLRSPVFFLFFGFLC